MARGLRKLDPTAAPVSTALGVLGMPGMTAYVGVLEIGQPKPGETVVCDPDGSSADLLAAGLGVCDCAARADRRDRGPPHGLLNGWDNIALTESYMDKIARSRWAIAQVALDFAGGTLKPG